MPKSAFAERLAPLGRVRDIPRVSSGSPEELILRPERRDVAVIPAVLALAKRGLSMLRAKRAMEAMLADGKVIVELPTVESPDALAADLKGSGVAVRFRSLEDREMMEDFPGYVRRLRRRLKMTQEGFAQAYALDVKTVRGWEAGKVPDRGNRTFIRTIAQDPVTTERLVNAS